MNRYSAIAVELQDWQGGTVFDLPSHSMSAADIAVRDQAHLTCAVRELAEETGLVVNPDVKHFATLRFTTDGQPGECRFFCCVGDVDAATTKEAERVFVDDECEHGFDFCPTCDACNCEVSKLQEQPQ